MCLTPSACAAQNAPTPTAVLATSTRTSASCAMRVTGLHIRRARFVHEIHIVKSQAAEAVARNARAATRFMESAAKPLAAQLLVQMAMDARKNSLAPT
jgi:exonuclease VII large subunit